LLRAQCYRIRRVTAPPAALVIDVGKHDYASLGVPGGKGPHDRRRHVLIAFAGLANFDRLLIRIESNVARERPSH
jgi:hypothetical protein